MARRRRRLGFFPKNDPPNTQFFHFLLEKDQIEL